MACYAVGDLQGCLDPLQRLLERLRFEPGTDVLWLTGDLVNRGPQSLECLRFVRALGDVLQVGNKVVPMLVRGLWWKLSLRETQGLLLIGRGVRVRCRQCRPARPRSG